MLVKIRLSHGPAFRYRPGTNRQLALATAALLNPAALMAWVLALWGIAADLQIAREFAISHGIFSHWQVWSAMGIALLLSSAALNRYGRRSASYASNS